ncbi:hypothetical protein [Polyangium aurulentum]|uniref:hypothetical protein n=1 Tax=Polyangium aurulentum TaxID=2567896 RepID=UPI0010ADF00C|nr:hypothetical protein [Polyangium aurulentum]UQA56546.1 hypothetical protein E8A73_035325 [Polyangium aurulentum]
MKASPRIPALLAALAIAASARPARAQSLPNNDYSIDLFQGPILAPIRVIGIAGAYAGYAEGIAGMVANAAAPAVRSASSTNWAEIDVGLSASIPFLPAPKQRDFDNSGDIDYDYSRFFYVTAGLLGRIGPLGIGASGEAQRYTLTGEDGAGTAVTVGKLHLLSAVALYDHQLILGGGGRAVALIIDAPEAKLTMAGIAPEVGMLLRPNWKSYRLGLTFRMPVEAGGLAGNTRAVDALGVERAGDLVVPQRVVLPWELELGVAVQIGPKPLNPTWIDPHAQEAAFIAALEQRRADRARARQRELDTIRDPALRAARERALMAEEAGARTRETLALRRASQTLQQERLARYWNWPREHLLITAELLVSGAVPRGVSIETFLGQTQPDRLTGPSFVGTSGARPNFSPRFGIETEPIPNRLHTRFGSYYEPRRFGGVGRQHFTFGADLRVLTTTFGGLLSEKSYTLQTSFDVAPRYQAFSFSVGIWR